MRTTNERKDITEHLRRSSMCNHNRDTRSIEQVRLVLGGRRALAWSGIAVSQSLLNERREFDFHSGLKWRREEVSHVRSVSLIAALTDNARRRNVAGNFIRIGDGHRIAWGGDEGGRFMPDQPFDLALHRRAHIEFVAFRLVSSSRC